MELLKMGKMIKKNCYEMEFSLTLNRSYYFHHTIDFDDQGPKLAFSNHNIKEKR